MISKTGINFKIVKIAAKLSDLDHQDKITVKSSDTNDHLYFEAIALHSDIPNGNGDLFPWEEVYKEDAIETGNKINKKENVFNIMF